MAADKTESLLRRSQFLRRESALAIALTCLRLVRTRWLLGRAKLALLVKASGAKND